MVPPYLLCTIGTEKNLAPMGIGAFSIQASLLGFLSKKSIGYYILIYYIRTKELIYVESLMYLTKIESVFLIEKIFQKKEDIFLFNI